MTFRFYLNSFTAAINYYEYHRITSVYYEENEQNEQNEQNGAKWSKIYFTRFFPKTGVILIISLAKLPHEVLRKLML